MTATKAKAKSSGTVKLKWVRSAIQAPVKHKLVVKGLGFTAGYLGGIQKAETFFEIIDQAERLLKALDERKKK